MRVDKVADMLTALKPAPSSSFKNFYEKAWNPDNFKDVPLPEPKKKEEPKKDAAEEKKE